MDITGIILDDHKEQRAMFAMLEDIDPADTEALAAVWRRLRDLLEVHAEAEERFFYPRLLEIGTGANDAEDAEDETRDAIEDHNDIRDASEAVDRYPVGSKEWFAAIDKANKANSDHMAEEERQGLADFRHNATLDESHSLAVRFVTFKYRNFDGIEAKDKDPDAYIARHSKGGENAARH